MIWTKIVTFSRKYPLTRGMAAYALIWPSSSVCQELIMGKETIDFDRAMRFCIFGSLFVAPTLHGWLKVAKTLWPGTSMKAAITKALVEQVTYSPMASSCFFFGMSLLEGKELDEAILEVHTKFLPTYKIQVCVWPVLQTINHLFIKERNKVAFVSVCSFMWTSFLSYMKQLEARKMIEEKKRKVQLA